MSLSEAWPDKRDRATTNSPGNSRRLELSEVTADRHRTDAEATGHVLYSKRPTRDQVLSEHDKATLTIELVERGCGSRDFGHLARPEVAADQCKDGGCRERPFRFGVDIDAKNVVRGRATLVNSARSRIAECSIA
jgi:hypothetical protein